MTADASSDSMAIVRVASSVRFHVGGLGAAAADGVADAPLVDLHRSHGPARLHQLGKELVQRVGVPGERGRGDAECVQDAGHRGRRQREPELHHRLPPLQAVGVDLPELLDVHQAGADLDVRASWGEEVELVALLDGLWGQRGQGGLRGPEALAEDAPFPARDDRGHDCTPQRAATGPPVSPRSYVPCWPGATAAAPGSPGGGARASPWPAAWSGRPRPAARRGARPGRPGRAAGPRRRPGCGRRRSGGG